MTLKEQILAYMQKHKLSQQEFADKCKVSVATIYRVMQNRCKEIKTPKTRGRIYEVLEDDMNE